MKLPKYLYVITSASDNQIRAWCLTSQQQVDRRCAEMADRRDLLVVTRYANTDMAEKRQKEISCLDCKYMDNQATEKPCSECVNVKRYDCWKPIK